MRLFLLLPFLFCNFCFSQEKPEIHAHRGFRGLFPENTLTGFKGAVIAGADYIELDVVISKDSQVVVSHEPWFNPDICTTPDEKPVTRKTKNNLHKLNYTEIKKYDCGLRGNKKFPDQMRVAEYKPLLSEVIAAIEKFTSENNLPPMKYNIEIKNKVIGDRKYHFDTKTTTALILAVIKKFNIDDRMLIQSFDVRCLKEIHKTEKELKTGLLIGNPWSVKHNIRKLGFTPTYYNPAYKICKKKTVHQAHKKGCKVAVWTVNSDSDFKRLTSYGVDGIITDFPPR